jgi:pimeloyl-ACP methyl ester carboxylesterase
MSYVESPTLQVSSTNGIDYAYRQVGQGAIPLVLFQHFRGNLDNWDPALIDTLAVTRRIIAFDNAGVGGSTGTTPRTVTRMAHDALAFLDALQIARADLLGFSIGSFVAQEIALIRPDVVRRLVLASSAPRGADGMHGWARDVIEAVGSPTTAPDAYLSVFFSPSDASRRAGHEALVRMHTRTTNRDTATTWETRLAQYDAVCEWGIPDHANLQRLEGIEVPVFVANGDSDPMILPRYSHLLTGLLRDARLSIYPDAAHGFLFQHHGRFAGDVEAFLSEGEPVIDRIHPRPNESVATTRGVTVVASNSEQHSPGPRDVTVVLVHGAFADASSWTGVIEQLQQRGHTVMAPPNPLRGLAVDSAYLASVLDQIDGPVLLVGHSYAGAVISNAATTAGNVRGLVFVAAFAPDEGEVLGAVAATSRDSLLGAVQVPYRYPTGPDGQTATEFAIDPAKLHEVFAADLPARQAAVLAATQRPVAEAAFTDPSGPPAWKTLPSWAVVAAGDRAAGADLVRSMARRAGAETVELDGSHVIMVSRPEPVADLIGRAVAAIAQAAELPAPRPATQQTAEPAGGQPS